ncbi:MAG: hypothetical protein R2932_54215 [Caldilineaceae bacterium]
MNEQTLPTRQVLAGAEAHSHQRRRWLGRFFLRHLLSHLLF